MSLFGALDISASGLSAERMRMDVTAENLANADSTAQVPGGDPYRRKTISFAERPDRETGAELVDVSGRGQVIYERSPVPLPRNRT